jgi:hypothetical protein
MHHANRSWPPGGQPNAHCWTLWKAALTTCFIQPHDTHQRLRRPLGAWLKQPQHWKWFYSPNQDSLFEQEHECSWIRHARNQGTLTPRHQGFRRTAIRSQQLPADAQPTTIYGRHIKRMRGSQLIQTPPPTTVARWWYEMLQPSDHHASIIQGIVDGTALWVVDGSYKEPYSTAAFILLPNLNAKEGITLVNQTPGRHEDMDAYRVEVGGIYGCIAFTNELAKHHKITTGKITMAHLKRHLCG